MSFYELPEMLLDESSAREAELVMVVVALACGLLMRRRFHLILDPGQRCARETQEAYRAVIG